MFALVRKAMKWARMRLYNEYTIAEYFRRQGARIGPGVRLLVRNLGSEPYLVSIGENTLVSNEVFFVTHDGATWVFRRSDPSVNRFGRIDIGANVFVGARTILLPGTSIGDRTIIGAGSVVRGSIPSGVVAAGVPARVIGSVEDFERRARQESLPVQGLNRDELRDALLELLPSPW
jgi:acetyltransferase-like isoleucine patch superfamily enzyme